MTGKRNRGRPQKPRSEKQSKRAVVHLTQGDAELLRADSEGLGMSPSAFLAGLWREWRMFREN